MISGYVLLRFLADFLGSRNFRPEQLERLTGMDGFEVSRRLRKMAEDMEKKDGSEVKMAR